MSIAGTGVEVILAGSLAGFAAQLIKFLTNALVGRPVNFRLIVETGGMPSSHSASMMGLATSVGLIEGFDSVIFAVALGLAMVVMYDAAGVRRAAGRMAGILNKMMEDLYTDHTEHFPGRLRELLGHTPVEVLAGFVLGIGMALTLHRVLLLGY
jgi:acid phosphatase family membrane protein YuiD